MLNLVCDVLLLQQHLVGALLFNSVHVVVVVVRGGGGDVYCHAHCCHRLLFVIVLLSFFFVFITALVNFAIVFDNDDNVFIRFVG